MESIALSHSYLVYAGVVSLAGLLVLWLVVRRLRAAETLRQSRLEHMKRFDAVRTESPDDDPTELARQRAIGNVEFRFSLIRATIVPSIAGLTVLLVVLPLLEAVPATILTLVVAVIGVVVSIAAKPFLENFISGVVLSFTKPIRIGDTVLIDGNFGTVEDISVTHTMIKIWDWRRLMIPNEHMLRKEFVNYSIVDRYQWAYVEFHVAPDADVDHVRTLAIEAGKASRSFAPYEDPRFWVMELGKESMRCWVAAWADTPSAAWQLTHDIRTQLATALQQAGIDTHTYRHRVGPPPGDAQNPPPFDEFATQPQFGEH